MKMLAVLLSVATIILSPYPCCQESESCGDISFIDRCGDNSSEEIPHDGHTPCSPFYSCGSCPGFTINYEFLELTFLVHTQEKSPIPYIGSRPEGVYFYALKPPQKFEV